MNRRWEPAEPSAPLERNGLTSRWRFGRCVLDHATRQLWRDGVLQPLQPRSFDVLALLVRERERVVTRDELLALAWDGRVVSPSAIARAIVLLRRHIGDDGDRPAMVRTVHGVGYQFVAPVEPDEPAPVGAAMTTGVVVPPAVPFLGLRFAAGCDTAAVLGFSTREFAAALQEAWPPRAPVLHWMEDEGTRSGAAAPWPEITRPGVLEGDEALRPVLLTLTREPGCIWLDWQMPLPDGRVQHGSVREVDLRTLARRTAGLLPEQGSRARLPVEAAVGDDPYACRCCARAQELDAWQDWDGALRLYGIAQALLPRLPAARLGRVQALVRRRDPGATGHAQALLDQARAEGDAQLATRCEAILDRLGARASAVADVGPAGRLAQAAPRPAGVPDPAQALAAAYRAPFDVEVIEPLAHAAEAFRREGDELGEANMLRALGGLLLLREAVTPAREAFQRAQALDAAAGAPLSQAHALGLNVLALARFGRVGDAREALDRTLDHVVRSSHLASQAYVLSGLALAALDTADLRRLRRVAAALAAADQTAVAIESDHPARVLVALAIDAAQGHLARASSALRSLLSGSGLRNEPLVRLFWQIELLRMVASTGDADGLAWSRERLVALDPRARSPGLMARLLHADAALAARHGRNDEALEYLTEAISFAPAGRTLGVARLDAAWIHCEQGMTSRAERLWQASGPHGLEHPLGLAVRARLAAAAGDAADALRWQQRALAGWGGPGAAEPRAWLAVYRAMVRGESVAVERSYRAGLASDGWWLNRDDPPQAPG